MFLYVVVTFIYRRAAYSFDSFLIAMGNNFWARSVLLLFMIYAWVALYYSHYQIGYVVHDEMDAQILRTIKYSVIMLM